jgi:hypothetical protein
MLEMTADSGRGGGLWRKLHMFDCDVFVKVQMQALCTAWAPSVKVTNEVWIKTFEIESPKTKDHEQISN